MRAFVGKKFYYWCMYVSISFLRLHLRHMEVLRLGLESELQLTACATATAVEIWATSATYAAAHSNARSLTHWPRAGIKPTSSWILVWGSLPLSHDGSSQKGILYIEIYFVLYAQNTVFLYRLNYCNKLTRIFSTLHNVPLDVRYLNHFLEFPSWRSG